MEYSSNKESEEKKLNDVETEIEGDPGIEKKVQELEQRVSDISENSLNFSESEIEEKFKESRKRRVTLNFIQAQELLTEKRRELLQTLSEKEFDSITELSEELDRDKKNVSQDIKKLYQNGIVDLKDQGRSKKPVFEFEEIEIEGLEFEENKSEQDRFDDLNEELKKDRLKAREQKEELEKLTDQNKELLDELR